MALLKNLISDDGVPIVYHRISQLIIITNIENLIEVKSYPTKELRDYEIEMLAGEDPSFIPWTQTRWYSAPYDPTMTIQDAYEWLKTAEMFFDNENQFLGSEDVLEEYDSVKEGGF